MRRCGLLVYGVGIVLATMMTAPPWALAQSAAQSETSATSLPEIDGPPAPIAPEVINRDARGNATVRAVRVNAPLDVDGRLDEHAYLAVKPIGDLVQQLPDEGARATEQTDVWVLYDDENLYVSIRSIDSHPERIVATEMRRDNNRIFMASDSFTLVLDTFYDRRSGFFFQTNPLSALRDQTIAAGQQNESWNTVWRTKSALIANGWTCEIAIPFKSLRYRQPGPQVWGINFRRGIKWKNESSGLTPVPASYGPRGLSQMEFAGTLVGVDIPGRTANLEIKPYAIASVGTDLTAATPFRNDPTQNVGFDFKYGLTRSLTADVSVNTDFAQVEEDLQQVNLTRFSLFFPEKREFFLEGQGLFAFGGRALTATTGAGADVPVLFFSRQVGLSSGQSVPVVAGARVTGKAGPFDVGLLNIQTAEKTSIGAAPTNFSVVRLRRDIFRASSIGFLATERLPTSGGGDSNLALGADATLRFFTDLGVTAYYARTRTPGTDGDDSSYRGLFDYAGDRYGLSLEHLMVGREFRPEVGFLRRADFRRSSAVARFSPRLRAHKYVRQMTWQGNIDYVTDAAATTLENRSAGTSFGIEFHSGDETSLSYAHEYELLAQPFRIAPQANVTVPIGGYESQTVRASYTLAPQRRFSGRFGMASGSFYDGTKQEVSYSGRIGFAPQFALEPSVSLNWVDLPYGDFTARVLSSRFVYTPAPLLMVSSLIQFNSNSNTLSSSLRLRWEYAAGSELFVVYADGRDTAPPGFPELVNRSVAVKVTRLLRF